MDLTLTETQRALKELARDFVKAECPREKLREWDANEVFPRHLIRKLGDLGFTGLPFPEEVGGAGGSVLDVTVVTEELARGMRALSAAYLLVVSYGGESILRFGSPAQKASLLPRLIQGDMVISLAVTEPDAGSDAGAVQTTAELHGDEFVINGSKTFISGVQIADMILVLARTDRDLPKTKGLGLILVDKETPGLVVSQIHKLGERAMDLNSLSFNDVRVPRENLVGGLTDGWRQLGQIFDVERVLIAAEAVGIADMILADALEYVAGRRQFGTSIGSFQMVQEMLVDAHVELEAARLLTYRAAQLIDAGMPCTKEAAMAKLYAGEMCVRAALKGMQVMGGYSYTTEWDMERYLRDSVLFPIGGGTSQIQRLVIARQMGLGADR